MKIGNKHVSVHIMIGWWCIATAVIFAVVSLSLSQWAKFPPVNMTGEKNYHSGWYGPFKNRTGWKNKKLELVKYLTIVSIATAAISFALCTSSHMLVGEHHKSEYIRLAGLILAWISALMFFVSISIFPTIKDVSSHLKWGYVLTCVSSMLMVFGAVLISMPRHMVVPESHYMDNIATATIAGVTGRSISEVAVPPK